MTALKRYILFDFKNDRPKGGLYDCINSADDLETAVKEARNRLIRGKVVQVFDCKTREIVFEKTG